MWQPPQHHVTFMPSYPVEGVTSTEASFIAVLVLIVEMNIVLTGELADDREMQAASGLDRDGVRAPVVSSFGSTILH